MMSRIQRAVKDYMGDCSCAQSIVAAFAPDFGLTRGEALRISSAFGSGMGHGSYCGAITGAMMVLGLKFGPADDEDGGEEKTHEAVEFFVEQFIQLHGSIICSELLRIDQNDLSTVERAIEEDYTHTRCPLFVKDAATILECMLCPSKAN